MAQGLIPSTKKSKYFKLNGVIKERKSISSYKMCHASKCAHAVGDVQRLETKILRTRISAKNHLYAERKCFRSSGLLFVMVGLNWCTLHIVGKHFITKVHQPL